MNHTIIKMPPSGGDYPIICGAGALQCAAEYFGAGEIALVHNHTVQALYPNLFLAAAVRIDIKDGEVYKTWDTVGEILEQLIRNGMRRDGTIIAFGGGVVGDMAGFAAAIYMRGVRLIQMPTTLLAQVDAAIGGKTGVNHSAGKNMIGAFYRPAAVICDTDFLATLPPREYNAGLAEVVKYALLGSADFFVWLERNAHALIRRDSAAVQEVVIRSVQMKVDIVAEDEREISGRRALLNLGHTFAHGIENAAGYGEWLHGEAVAAGLVAAAKLSELICGFDKTATVRIIDLLTRLRLPINFCGLDGNKIVHAMWLDKKFTATDVRFVLMNEIGDAGLYPLSEQEGRQKIYKAIANMPETKS